MTRETLIFWVLLLIYCIGSVFIVTHVYTESEDERVLFESKCSGSGHHILKDLDGEMVCIEGTIVDISEGGYDEK